SKMLMASSRGAPPGSTLKKKSPHRSYNTWTSWLSERLFPLPASPSSEQSNDDWCDGWKPSVIHLNCARLPKLPEIFQAGSKVHILCDRISTSRDGNQHYSS